MGIQDRDYYRDDNGGFRDVWGRQGVVLWIVALTVGVFLGQCVTGDPIRSPLVARGAFQPQAILDGEVVALDGEGRQNFRDLLAGRGNLHYAAFDALWVRGRDLRGLALTRRKRALTGLIPATTTVVSQVFSIGGRGRDLFDAAERLDLEGIVAKRTSDPYRPDTVWYKIKSRTYTQSEGRWELFQGR